MSPTTDSVEDTRDQLGSLISYLRDLHALRNPPVRNIAAHSAFRLDPQRLSEMPGVMLRPSPDTWLTTELLVPPNEPALPGDLIDIAVPRLVSGDRPVARADTDEAGKARLEQWARSVWDTWKRQREEIELSRRLYLDLFAARDQIEADGAGLELVWGFGLVRWREHDVDHPLFTVGLEIEYTADAARLDIRPARPLRAETEVLTGLPLVAQRQLFEAMTTIEGTGDDPWQREFEPDLLTPLLLMMSHTPAADGGPRMRLGEWAIFARRKPSGYLSFVRGLEGNLDSLASLPTLASLVAADPRRFDVAEIHSTATPTERNLVARETLLPLLANDEQREILRHAASAPGVTVEGPPGTGKSHTIANLISGFIADGKRVLVTAERAQALEVLLNKIPEALQPLCVPVLGSGQEERMRLENAIDRISQAAFGLESHRADADQLPKALDDTARSIAEVRNRLREVRRIEALPVPEFVPSDARASRADAADWLHRHEPQHSFVTDALAADATLPWTVDEQVYLIETLASVPPSDLQRAQDVTATILIPGSGDLARYLRERDTWLHIADSSPDVVQGTELQAEDELSEVGDLVGSASEAVAGWENGPFQTAFEQLAAGPQQQLWRAFSHDLTIAVSEAYSLRSLLQAHLVEIPGDAPFAPEEQQLLRAAQTVLEGGGRLGFSQRRARQILGPCRVDGRVPSTAADLALVLAESDLRSQRLVVRNLMNTKRESLALSSRGETAAEDEAAPVATDLALMIDWLDVRWPSLHERLADLGIRCARVADSAALKASDLAVRARLAVSRVAQLDAEHALLVEGLREREQTSTAPDLWRDLRAALDSQNWDLWDNTRAEILRLSALQDAAQRVNDLLDRVSKLAPKWAEHLRSSASLTAETAGDLAFAWTWRKVETWFRSTEVAADSDSLEDELRRLERVQQSQVGQLAASRAWLAVTGRIDGPTQVALAAYKTVNARIGKGYSKFKSTYQRQLEEALAGCRHVIPAWVMPVERVLSDFACDREPLFDVLIIDEASQLPMTRLPILALARKVIVVGDDKQISPSSPGLEIQPALEALRSRLDLIQNAGATYFVGASVYDVAVQRFPRKVQLREHFRCLTPIIEFSNSRYYDGRLVPLRDRLPTPQWRPLCSVLVADGFRDADDCNRPEAERIAELMADLVQQPDYATRTFGVITLLGRNQSKLVYDLVFEALGPAKMSAHAVRIGEAATFQGDERDVIFLSTVVSDSGGRSIGAMTAKAHQQMVNVAASRARDQLWIVHSVPADAFPTGDERAALIRHCSAAVTADEAYADLVLKTDDQSPFERDLLRHLVARGYRTIRPQHQVGRYRIDFVIDGPSSRLAIECDGDRFHGPEHWDADRARQAVLERAGWTFIRIRGSSFYRDPARALGPLWAKLDELGIPPFDWTARSPQTPTSSSFEPTPLPSAEQCPETNVGDPVIGSADTAAPESREPEIPADLEPRVQDPRDTSAVAQVASEDPWAAAFEAAERRIREQRQERQG
jgi:very-short-patch-repair endonuclease